MRHNTLAGILLTLLPLIAAGAEQAGPQTEKEKRSYSIGINMGKTLSGVTVDIDYQMLARGVADAISGNKQLKDEEIQGIIVQFYQDISKQKMENHRKLAEKNKTEGEAFLAENAKKEGVVTLPSGLQYKVLVQGTGPKPTENDRVKTNYRGTLIDGTEFDSSFSRNEPTVFPLIGVIAGWSEALQLMPVGSKWMIYVPPSLAYGNKQATDKVGPNATLIFEIELMSIEPEEEHP
jgi:FKBP-type peptidyl-prolyl cis-trans isomerase FklB